jgi:hypothetical protein
VGLISWLTLNAGVFILALTLAVLALIGVVVWLALRLRKAEARYFALVDGTTGGNLESMLTEHMVQVRDATGRVVELDELARRLERGSRGHLQRVGFLRFNPFRDAGGDQSFAVAVTDQDGNGVVISSLHSRDVTRVYGKPLAGWASPYPLTDEEEQAIKKARDQGSGTRDQESVTSNEASMASDGHSGGLLVPSQPTNLQSGVNTCHSDVTPGRRRIRLKRSSARGLHLKAGCAATAACGWTVRWKAAALRRWATC